VDVDELFDGWERAWSGRDPRAFEPVCLPDVHYEDPLTEPLEGRAGLIAHALRLWEGAPDVRVQSMGARLHDGRFACAPCKVLGTHTRSWGKLAAAGRPFEVHALVYAELRAGKLWRVRAFFDAYDAARQLGVLPRPGTAGERALLMLRGFGLRG
jgi:ketosteroid isomerase-like protein